MKKLNETMGKNPFKVPENYFEEINRKILSDTAGHNHEFKKTGLFTRFRVQLAVAASVAGIILLSYASVKILTAEKNNLQVSEVIFEENTELYINDIDLNTLEEKASSLDLNNEESGVSKNEIIDYLLFENIEISDIYE
jgi:hypothetical protein